MRLVMVALTLALLTVPTYAEMNQTTARSDAQKKADKEADDAYKAMIKNVPDKPRNKDPWADMRGSDAAASNTQSSGTPAHNSHATAKKPK